MWEGRIGAIDAINSASSSIYIGRINNKRKQNKIQKNDDRSKVIHLDRNEFITIVHELRRYDVYSGAEHFNYKGLPGENIDVFA